MEPKALAAELRRLQSMLALQESGGIATPATMSLLAQLSEQLRENLPTILQALDEMASRAETKARQAAEMEEWRLETARQQINALRSTQPSDALEAAPGVRTEDEAITAVKHALRDAAPLVQRAKLIALIGRYLDLPAAPGVEPPSDCECGDPHKAGYIIVCAWCGEPVTATAAGRGKG